VGMDGRPIIKFWSKNSTDPIKGATSMAFYWHFVFQWI
jgi:hypothetical protein